MKIIKFLLLICSCIFMYSCTLPKNIHTPLKIDESITFAPTSNALQDGVEVIPPKKLDLMHDKKVSDQKQIKEIKLNVEYTIVVGQLLNQEYVPDVQPSSCFEEGVLCMSSYYLFEIKIHQVLSGDSLLGNIKVARYQHAKYYFRSGDLSVFVLEKINNKKTQNLLGSDYFLEDWIEPRTEYCFSQKHKKYLNSSIEWIRYGDCIKQSELLNKLKSNVLESIAENVKEHFKSYELLFNMEEFVTNGIDVVEETEEEEDFWHENCSDILDWDVLDIKSGCFYDGDDYDMYQFDVKKGTAKNVENKIKSMIIESKINLSNIDMKFIIIEKINKSILQWHYRVNN